MVENLTRKLVAILYADVAGYSRLTGDDEEGTHHRVMDTLDYASRMIGEMRGTVLRYAGDAILAEFTSVIVAVKTAIQVQKDLAERNEPLPDEQKVQIRIGISLGDVIEDRGEVYGDGVNLAARLEAGAIAGGICISEIVHGQVEGKIDTAFVDGGEENFKNISRPVRVHHWSPDGKVPESHLPQPSGPTASRKLAIAVLPLNNMSGNTEQDYFCDGITEDIITALSRTRWFTVTARNSTFAYKGRSPDVREVASALNVDYVLEGSVRKGKSKLRIATQLIDGSSGDHVWADTFDRTSDDEFEIQDEIAQRVTSNLVERIWQDAARNIGSKSTDEYSAFDFVIRGLSLIHQIDPKAINEATGFLTRAVELDDEVAMGHLGLGFCHLIHLIFWDDPSGEAPEGAWRHARKMKELAPDDANTYRLLSRVCTVSGMYDEAAQYVERAIKINPHDGDIIGNKGVYLMFLGELEQAVTWFDKVLELHADTPHTVDIMNYWKALSQFMSADYETTLRTLKSISGLDYIKTLLFSACYAMLGDERNAKSMSRTVLEHRPALTVSDIGLIDCFRQEDHRKHLRSALESSGLPE